MIRESTEADRPLAVAALEKLWGGVFVIAHGVRYDASRLPGFLAVSGDELITSNDNVDALRFYQRRGMRIAGVDPGAVDRARALKPTIPLVGDYGIELHDELTLEIRLAK